MSVPIPDTTILLCVFFNDWNCFVTSECEETEERNLVNCLLRIVDLLEETEVRVAFDGIVAVRNHAGERIADVPALNDGEGLLHIPGQKDERQNNTGSKDPLQEEGTSK